MSDCEILCINSIIIGKKVLIGANVKIMDSVFHKLNTLLRHLPGKSIPIIIHDNCWLGIDCLLLKGTEIGENTVIAAKSFINYNSVYGGAPAGYIKSL